MSNVQKAEDGGPRRSGSVRIHDTTVSMWEDHNDDTMNKVVLGALIAFLRGRGWKARQDETVDKIIRNHYYVATKGPLRARIDCYGRALKCELWSTDYPSDHPTSHQYDFDKRRRMPYATRIRADVEMNAMVRWAVAAFGYTLGGDNRRKLGATEFIAKRNTGSGHYDSALGHARIEPHNAKSGDGNTIKHGSVVWYRGCDGRARRGVARYNLNNMWWVVSSEDDFHNMGSHQILTAPPSDLRRAVDPSIRRDRLEREHRAALDAEDYDRAKMLRRLAFGDGPLYWLKKGDSLYATNARGYVGDTSRAGRFTAEEARRLMMPPEVVAVPIGKAPPLAEGECK